MSQQLTTTAPQGGRAETTCSDPPRSIDLGGEGRLVAAELPDLAPMIHRQRLVVEGHPRRSVSDEQIVRYLNELSDVCAMHTLLPPVTHRSDMYGWAGWIHWETSGAHFYAWDQPLLFFSVDIYTCKRFSAERVLEFTGDFFEASALVGKEF